MASSSSDVSLFRAMDTKDASPPPSPHSLLDASTSSAAPAAAHGCSAEEQQPPTASDENADDEDDELRATDRKKREARVLSQLLLLFCAKRSDAPLSFPDGDTTCETLFTASFDEGNGVRDEQQVLLLEGEDLGQAHTHRKSDSAREYAVTQQFLAMPRISQKKIVQSLFVLQPSLIDNFAPVLQFFIRVVIEAHSDSHAQHATQSDNNGSSEGVAAEQQTQVNDEEDSANAIAGRRIQDPHCAWARNGHVNCIEIEQSDANGADASSSSSSNSNSTTTTFRFPPDFHACLIEKYGSVKRNKCEEVWHGDHMAYRCRTCGLSDSSCMCLGCFDPDEHEGHDYRVYRCSSGGCCDCGDPLAWKPEGFCRKHSAAKEVSATARKSSQDMQMGKLEEEVVTLLVRRTVGFCVNVLREVYLFCLRPGGAYDSDPFYPMRSLPKTGRRRNSFPEIIQVYLDRVQQALAWLQMLATSCVKYRDIISEIFFETLPADFHLDPPTQPHHQSFYAPKEEARTSALKNGQQQADNDAAPRLDEREGGGAGGRVVQEGGNLLILDVFLKAGILLPVETCDVLGVLYLKLLFDHSFKQKYTCHFVEWYPYFIDLYLKASEENNEEGMRNLSRFIDRLFCQLFHSTAQLQELETVFSSTHGQRRRQRRHSPSSSGHSSCIEWLMLFLLEKLNGLFKSAARVETVQVKRRKTAGDGGAEDSTTLQYVVDCGRNVFKKRIYARICSDLRTLLVHPQVAADAVLNSFRSVDGDLVLDEKSVYGELIEAFRLLQQMDLQKRHVNQHIEYESQNWTFAFVVDYEVNLLLNAFLSGIPFCFSSDDAVLENASSETIEGSPTSSRPRASLRDRFELAKALLKPIRENVLSWTHQSGCPEWTPVKAYSSAATETEKMQQLMEFYQGATVLHQDPVKKSFHLPLHHMYASLIHALCMAIRPQNAQEWNKLLGCEVKHKAPFTTANEDALGELEFAMSLVEYPLRVCFFTREVKAGLWVRNGNAMWQQLTHYYSKHWRFYGVHSDLYLCQIGALVAPRGSFTRVFLRHFPFDLHQSFVFTLSRSGSKRVKEDQTSAEIRHELDLAEEMLRLLIQILLSPVKTSTSVAPVESFTYLLEREMMHWLSLGPFTRSEVITRMDMKLVEQVKQLPEHPWNRQEEEEILTQVLETVGVYEEPSSGSSASMGGSGINLLNFGLKMSGTWKLKPELWTKISPYFECFTPSEAQQCEQNLRTHLQNKFRSSARPAPETSALIVPVLSELHHEALRIHVVLAENVFNSSDLIGALFIVLLNWKRREKKSANNSGEGRDTSENLLLVALQCVFVGVQLLGAPDAAESEAIRAHNDGTKDGNLAVGATISDIAAYFAGDLSFITNLSAVVPGKESEATSLLSLLMEFASDDASLEDANALAQQILRIAGEKSAVCRSEIEKQRAKNAKGPAGGEQNVSNDDGREQDRSAIDERQRNAREMMRKRQQMILEKMRSQQMQFLSSHGEPKEKGGAAGAEPMAVDSTGIQRDDEGDEEFGELDDDDNDEEEDEWGFPTGQIDVQLYLDHVSSAIALSCEKEKKIYDRQRRQRRSSRNSSSRSFLGNSAKDQGVDHFIVEDEDAEECGLCRMPCERHGSPSSFGFVGMVLPTLVPQKMRELNSFSTPPLPSIRVTRTQSREDVSLALSDATIWSCGHPLHHECLKSYLSSLWKQKRPTDVMNGEDRLLSERDVEFQCPICRRLSNCLVPSVPQVNVREQLSLQGSSRALDEFEEEESKEDEDVLRESLVFVKWLHSQMSFQDDLPQVKRRKSRSQSYLRTRLNSTAAERDRLSAVERNIDRFYHDVTLRCLRAAMQLPLLMDDAIQDEGQIDTEIQDAVCALDVQLPAWQLFLQSLEVQVDLIEQERQLLSTDTLDKQRMQSMRYLAEVAVAASAMSVQNSLSWTVIDAPYDTKFDVVISKLNGIFFGHQVLFEEDDHHEQEPSESGSSNSDFRLALPILCHPNLFSFFVVRMVWRQGTQATSVHVAVEELVSEAFFLSRVLVTAQLLQALCCIRMRTAGNGAADVDNRNKSDEGGEDEKLPSSFGDFYQVQSLRDAYRWVSQLLSRCKLVGSDTRMTAMKWSDVEEEVSATCLPLVKRIVLLMEVLLPSSQVSGAADDLCAVCDGLFCDPIQSESKPMGSRTQELEKYLRRLHLPPLRLFFHAQMFSSDQRDLCQLWGAQLEAKAAVLRQQSQQLSSPKPHVDLFNSISSFNANLTTKEPPAKRLIISLPRIYMNLFIMYNEKPRGICQQCNQLPQHPAICLFCGVVLCCFSPCCESTRGNVGECTQHAQSCGQGFGAFMLLRACTVILFLGNERRCVWGSVYVDKNGEEDPYLRRGKTLYLDESRLLALESLLISHGFSQNTAILANTSRRDGRRY